MFAEKNQDTCGCAQTFSFLSQHSGPPLLYLCVFHWFPLLLQQPLSTLGAGSTLLRLAVLSVCAQSYVHINGFSTMLDELFVCSKNRTLEKHNLTLFVFVLVVCWAFILKVSPRLFATVSKISEFVLLCSLWLSCRCRATPCCFACGAVPGCKSFWPGTVRLSLEALTCSPFVKCISSSAASVPAEVATLSTSYGEKL